MTSSVTSACSPLRDGSENQHQLHYNSSSITEQRSCSANQLDVIVDILGVPSDLLNQRDSNKRLFLLKANDKKETVLRRNRPRRSGTCKVRSGGLAAPHGGAVGLGSEVGGHKGQGSGGGCRGPRERPPPLQSGNKSKSCEDQESQDLLMEVKRRSIYAKDCRLVVYVYVGGLERSTDQAYSSVFF